MVPMAGESHLPGSLSTIREEKRENAVFISLHIHFLSKSIHCADIELCCTDLTGTAPLGRIPLLYKYTILLLDTIVGNGGSRKL